MFFQWFWILWGLELSRSSHFGTKICTSSLYACGVWQFWWETLYILIWSTIKLKLKGLSKNFVSFNDFELYVKWNFPEVAILVPKVCSSRLYAQDVVGSFEDEIYIIRYAPRLNWHWKACNWTCFFIMVLNYVWNWKTSEVASVVPKVYPTNIFNYRNC